MASDPMRVIVMSEDGKKALGDVPELDVVVVDRDDPSTFPESARAVVTERETPDAVEPVLRTVSGVEVVQLLSAGIEDWVDVLPEGVSLVNARGAHGGSTAEWAVASLLAVRRAIPVFVEQQSRGVWEAVQSPGLQGATVLVLGAGDLGEQTRRRLDGFGCEVTLLARSARDGVVAMSELPSLLPTADAVVLVLPLTEETRGLVDAAFLAALPDGAVVVNAARGAVVDTDALLAELSSGRLRAALDVTDPEPLPEGHPLWSAPGVLVTPHVGGHTVGSGERAWGVVREQLLQLARGERPTNTMGREY